jgi:phenylacetate-CoA ligase
VSLRRAAIWQARAVLALPLERRYAQLARISEKEFWQIQRRLLNKIYRDAITHVPYYRSHSGYPEALPRDGTLGDVLGLLPTLGKSTIRLETESFWRHPSGPTVTTHTTGGTTGTPLRVRAGIYDRLCTHAIVNSTYHEVLGLPRSFRVVILSSFLSDGSEQASFWYRFAGTNAAFLSIYHLREANKSEIARCLLDYQPDLIYGYASALTQLAELYPGGDLSAMGDFRCVSTAETLTPEQRKKIEGAFESRVHDQYGSQEGQHFALECVQGSMHIHPARGIIEILKFDSDVPAAPGELGRVVVTGLSNRNMPLLRYSIGDSAVSTGFASGCECGLAWPTIGRIEGRTEDLVRTRDGRRIGLLSFAVTKDVEGVLESQIVQRGYGRFDFRVRTAPGADTRRIERHLTQQLERRLGESVTVRYQYVDELPRTLSGKVQAVVVAFD